MLVRAPHARSRAVRGARAPRARRSERCRASSSRRTAAATLTARSLVGAHHRSGPAPAGPSEQGSQRSPAADDVSGRASRRQSPAGRRRQLDSRGLGSGLFLPVVDLDHPPPVSQPMPRVQRTTERVGHQPAGKLAPIDLVSDSPSRGTGVRARTVLRDHWTVAPVSTAR